MPKLPKLHVENNKFVDEHGRHVLLRGMNLGGDCKLPCPNGGTHIATDFADHHEVAFVGRPLPHSEADSILNELLSGDLIVCVCLPHGRLSSMPGLVNMMKNT